MTAGFTHHRAPGARPRSRFSGAAARRRAGPGDHPWRGAERVEALGLDADELPLFRPDPAVTLEASDLATALRLEQEALAWEDLGRAGMR